MKMKLIYFKENVVNPDNWRKKVTLQRGKKKKKKKW